MIIALNQCTTKELIGEARIVGLVGIETAALEVCPTGKGAQIHAAQVADWIGCLREDRGYTGDQLLGHR